MKRLIVDLETNGLLDTVDRIHCAVVREPDTGLVRVFSEKKLANTQRDGGIKDLARVLDGQHWIGHNLIGYDNPVLEKLKVPCAPGEVTDTLVQSYLFYPELTVMDVIRGRKNPSLPRRLYGKHSLEAWGYRLNCLKGEYGSLEGAFETYTSEMLDYCIQDTAVTQKLWEHQMKMLWPTKSVELEHKFAACIAGMSRRGFRFDVRAAHKLAGELEALQYDLKNAVLACPTWAPLVKRWVTKVRKQPREKLIEFNPASPTQIARALIERHGWEPEEFTDAGAPKTDKDVLAGLLDIPGVPELRRYLVVSQALESLATGKKSWISCVKPDGLIHQYVNHNGTPTGRCRHASPAANPPKVRVRKVKQADGTTREEKALGVDGHFGVEFRRLIVPSSPDLVLVGADASGLELRCLAHYMAKHDGGAYAKILLEADIHEANRVAAGLATRDQAKTFIYAFLYGAGDATIGKIVQGDKHAGAALKARFLSGLPALARVFDDMYAALEKRDMGRAYTWKGKRRIDIKPGAYLIGLDGRRLYLRSAHAMLNTLLQAAGAVVMKRATVNMHESWPNFRMIFHAHDEVQAEEVPSKADACGKTMVRAIEQAGEFFGFRCPLTGEYRVGKNWAETH